MSMQDLSVHDLFGLDPAEFVAARDRLARALKASGDKEQAATVKALRRPSVAAWALNQVARDHGEEVNTLLEAAAAARAAQDDAMASGEGDELRAALASRRAAIRSVVRLARELVSASGRSGEAQEREIESGVNAVLDAPALAAEFRRGELTDVRVADREGGTGDDGDGDIAAMFAPVTGTAHSARPETSVARAKKAPALTAVPAPKPDDRLATKRASARDEVARLEQEAAAAAARYAEAERAMAEADAEVARAQEAARFAHRETDNARRARTKAETALERARRVLSKLEQ
jgi:hypothetical protein